MSIDSTRAAFGDPAAVVSRLILAQKVSLVSGHDAWTTEPIPAQGVAAMVFADGPHGLRAEIDTGGQVGLGQSHPATCFPPAVTLGSTWDEQLIEEVGVALGIEARAQGVDVLLGPGLNIKRHPAGGRSFEYFSEDPLLSGKSAAAMVRGLQSVGTGACIKHLVANNQESWRMRVDTVVDERTLREVYLTGFEIAVRESSPWSVMTAYNLVNGEHAGESRRLITETLRDEWGFTGLAVSDWLAVADRPLGIQAGLDLEMPSSAGAWDRSIRDAIADGNLSEVDLDDCCTRIIDLVQRIHSKREACPPTRVDYAAHHALARRAAAAGTVLLTNDGTLPLRPQGTIALIGAFAEEPRYQGAGSSLVNPTRLDTALSALTTRIGDSAEIVYEPGYDALTGVSTPTMVARACVAARKADVAIVLVGLPVTFESEAFDRADLRLPIDHDALVRSVIAANPRTVVVLSNGAPVEMDWADEPAALVESYLGGQAGGSALIDVLVGDAEPGGRLAESFPVAVADLASDANFASCPTQVQYRETSYVGYRFHDTFDVSPRFCFGHGLSYTTFTHSDVAVTGSGTDWTVSLTLTNAGARAGSDVVQVYVHDVESSVHRPEQELRAYAKVQLDPGVSQQVTVTLDRRAFAVYNVATADWLVEPGTFEIRVGVSSRTIVATATVDVSSTDQVVPVPGPAGPVATDAEFARLLGRPIPTPRPLIPLHMDSVVDDLTQIPVMRPLFRVMLGIATRVAAKDPDPTTQAMSVAMFRNMPLRGLVAGSRAMVSFGLMRGLTRMLNLFAWRRIARSAPTPNQSDHR